MSAGFHIRATEKLSQVVAIRNNRASPVRLQGYAHAHITGCPIAERSGTFLELSRSLPSVLAKVLEPGMGHRESFLFVFVGTCSRVVMQSGARAAAVCFSPCNAQLCPCLVGNRPDDTVRSRKPSRSFCQ